MPWCTRSTRTAAPACPMPTLEGFALDHEQGFFGCDEALLDGLIDLGKQYLIFVAGTGWVNAAKGVVVRVDDLILHQDNKELVVVPCHDGHSPFCVARTHVQVDRWFHGAYTMR
jgi:hypothetical protein